MAAPYQTFQKFNDAGLAAVIAEKLKNKNIDYVLENEQPNFDPSYAFNHVEPTIHLKVSPTDFSRAHAALEEYYQDQLQDVDPDYYLLSFTDQELQEIIAKPDEWGHFDYALAKKLLADRGHVISSSTAEKLKQERLEQLAKPETTHIYWILAGYAGAVVSMITYFYFWAGLFGLLTGYIFRYMKKTLPNGEKVYIYSPRERFHGKWMMIFSIAASIIWLVRVLSLYN